MGALCRHGPGHWACNLKATADSPFDSTVVVALQPIPAPPVVPIRFASIYTDHVVLQVAPARAILWGFANVGESDHIKVTVTPLGASVTASLSPLPVGSSYADKWIWQAVLPPINATFDAQTVTVSVGEATASIIDVLFGDVFVCGGQVRTVTCCVTSTLFACQRSCPTRSFNRRLRIATFALSTAGSPVCAV